MTTARRHSHFIKLRMKQHSAGGVLASRRIAVNSHARQVHVRIFCRGSLHPQNAVRETRVLEIFPTDIVEGLGTISRSHAVDLHDDKPEVIQRLVPRASAERFWHE